MNIRPLPETCPRGYTLIELVIAVGLFALVMTLAAGSYLMMISLARQAQGAATGIDNLSFALETMTRQVRTGTFYSCGDFGGDCVNGAERLSFKDSSGNEVVFTRGFQGADGTVGAIVKNGSTYLTDPTVDITSLMFYVSGTQTIALGDYSQPYVTIVVSGKVSSGSGKAPQTFTVESSAAMRGIDLMVTLAPAENPVAPTCTLLSDSLSILAGGSALLSWEAVNATSFALDQGIGTVSPAVAGSYLVTPTETTTYTGTATNAGGSATCSVQVTIL